MKFILIIALLLCLENFVVSWCFLQYKPRNQTNGQETETKTQFWPVPRGLRNYDTCSYLTRGIGLWWRKERAISLQRQPPPLGILGIRVI